MPSRKAGRPKSFPSGEEPRQRTLFLPLGVFRKLEEAVKKIKKYTTGKRSRINKSAFVNAIISHYCTVDHADFLIERYKRTLTSHNQNQIKTVFTISPKVQKKLDTVRSSLKIRHTDQLSRYTYSSIISALVAHHVGDLEEIESYLLK